MDNETQGKGLVSRLMAFIKQPFQSEMDLGQWVLFTILIVTVAVLWCRVLADIEPIDFTA